VGHARVVVAMRFEQVTVVLDALDRARSVLNGLGYVVETDWLPVRIEPWERVGRPRLRAPRRGPSRPGAA
jgi:hypothetical protein